MDQYHLEETEDRIRLKDAWDRVVNRLKPEMAEGTLRMYVQPLEPRDLSHGKVTLGAPTNFVAEWVRSKFLGQITTLLSQELAEPVTVELVLLNLRAEKAHAQAARVRTVPAETDQRATNQLDSRYTFDTFVVGQSNRLAVAGARAVAENPGKAFNPLFIYGSSGLGKTHLLQAIAGEIRRRHPSMNIRYVSAQDYMEEFVRSIQTQKAETFRRAYRSLEVWLLDDLQFLLNKDKTQEEVFHTFNKLRECDRQIVLASDRSPREHTLVDERLKTRFECGLVADIQPPDTETRCAILLKKAERDRLALTTEIAMFLAENVPGNIRTLEGVLTKCAAQASLDGRALDIELARQIVERDFREGQRPGIDAIVRTVARHLDISPDEIMGSSRKAPIAFARHVSVYVAREITRHSWNHLGRNFNKDHTSMMYSHDRISELISKDPDMNGTVQRIIRELLG